MPLESRYEIIGIEPKEDGIEIEVDAKSALSEADEREIIAQYRGLFDESTIFYIKINGTSQQSEDNSLSDLPYSDAEVEKLREQKERELRLEMLELSRQPNAKTGNEPPKDCEQIYGPKISKKPKPIDPENDLSGKICYWGEVYVYDERVTKNQKLIVSFSLVDSHRGIGVKLFLNENERKKWKPLKNGDFVEVYGEIKLDTFNEENVLFATSIKKAQKPAALRDLAVNKRIEFKMHSDMTQMLGVVSIAQISKAINDMGHRGFVLTDEDVIQAYPEVLKILSDRAKFGIREDFKIAYGIDVVAVDISEDFVKNASGLDFEASFVVFDLETTGLNPVSDEIIEIGANKIVRGEIVDTFSFLVKTDIAITGEITELTGINQDMLKDAPRIEKVLPKFLEFIGNSILVAHNASFDISFLDMSIRRLGLAERAFAVLDTLALSRMLYPDEARHGLKYISKLLGVTLTRHHRAQSDVDATSGILLKMFEELRLRNIEGIDALNKFAAQKNANLYNNPVRISMVLKKQAGLSNFYEMISNAHIKYFFKRPIFDISDIRKNRENLLVGSGGVDGEVFGAVVSGLPDEKIIELIKFYDYIEIDAPKSVIYPSGRYRYGSYETYIKAVRKLIQLAKIAGVPCVAVSNAYYIDKEDQENHYILDYSSSAIKSVREGKAAEIRRFGMLEKHLRMTDEMFREFSFLEESDKKEIILENPNKLFDEVGDIRPIPKETFPPIIEGSAEELERLCYQRAAYQYGDNLPEEIAKRLDRELSSIIGNGYAVMYIVAQKLVIKSNEDGFLVGSRGSVGSSFAATMAGITEVNPLPPHYYCDEKPCHYVEFYEGSEYFTGFDLPEKNCPVCGKKLISDGHNIPFETFLGFKGEKEPDIDLNFAGEYQARAHEYTAEIFGEDYVFKAGTISTLQEKKAFGYIKGYLEEFGMKMDKHFLNKKAACLTGCKATTGQHPGGIMVVPNYKSIYDFSPIQHPANDKSKGQVTTHFDYGSLSGKILKLDILGHETPSTIRRLEDFTGFSATLIPFNDPDTMQIFSSNTSLNIKDPNYDEDSGALGIPEFGTSFVRNILRDTKPKTFVELAKICGVAHGTNVWNSNAEELIRNKTCTLMEAICVRDEIMTYLIRCNIEPSAAFEITEKVRKGKGLTPEYEELMKQHKVPAWYIESCKKISYMFPLAHSVAYVMMSFRIAYYKVHYPLAFYASYFSSNIEDFDAEVIIGGKKAVENELFRLKELGSVGGKSKETDKIYVLELVREMMARGFDFLTCDIQKSSAGEFLIVGDKLLIPFRAVAGLGQKAANNLVEYRKGNVLYSVADIKKVDGINKTAIENLKKLGSLDSYPESSQLTFDMFI